MGGEANEGHSQYTRNSAKSHVVRELNALWSGSTERKAEEGGRERQRETERDRERERRDGLALLYPTQRKAIFPGLAVVSPMMQTSLNAERGGSKHLLSSVKKKKKGSLSVHKVNIINAK